jgi:BMFP domain-containing protein YqiC
MTKVKEYVEINGKRVSVTAENLIKAYEKIEKLEKEIEFLEKKYNSDLSDRHAFFII